MAARHHDRARTALDRLAIASPADGNLPAPPRLLRAPYLAACWALLLLIAAGTLASGRIRVPHVTTGVIVAIGDPAHPDRREVLLLLPPSSRLHMRAGQLVTVDTGGTHPAPLSITHVEPTLLDDRTARVRFAAAAPVLPHLDGPRAVAHVACRVHRCLTPSAGVSYRATVALGSRTLASYVMPRS